MTTQKSQKQGALFLILIFIFTACSEQDDSSPLETKILKGAAETGTPKELDTSTFRLAAWNLRIFSNGSRNDNELRHIAKVLIDYDFIAIVELRDEVVLMRTEAILAGMGRDYDYVMSPSSRGEGEGTLRFPV